MSTFICKFVLKKVMNKSERIVKEYKKLSSGTKAISQFSDVNSFLNHAKKMAEEKAKLLLKLETQCRIEYPESYK
jgi:radical SAM superfamily enzyme YgiQ (UPF0313 family)